ncbi:MAG: alpha/beta hydrolase [Dehalococcoidia bacterium]|jgi:pimeloyl-ACP methyl ester carboxylesterase|nr:alpha/beta hydrolase [Dehalococcoidia bacterium]
MSQDERSRRPEGETPREFRVQGDGVELAVTEWAGEGPPLVFAHATSFHGRCWDEVIRWLPGRRAIAFDLRGHGRADVPSIEGGKDVYLWSHVADDIVAALRELGISDAIGIGHSMGGHSVTLAASIDPGLFAALLLVDPTITKSMGMPKAEGDDEQPGGGPHLFVIRRRNEWASAHEMFERFRGREPHSAWEPAVLRDYCEYGLLPNDDGDGFHLACPPVVEAAVYEVGQHDLSAEAPGIEVPVRILRARPRDPENPAAALSGSPTAVDLVDWFPNAEDFYLPEHTHFIPMEAPALVAQHIEELVGRLAADA